jgi:hypothetical protein
MRSDRTTWESHWQEVAERVLPRQDDFFKQQTPGAKRTDKIFDAVGEIALNKFAAVMEALLTPQTQTWHKLKPKDDRLNEVHAIRLWYDECNKILFAARKSPRARFHSMAHEGYMSLGAFGTSSMFIDKAPLGPLLYKSHHLSGVFFCENAWGVVDTVHREFKLTARQAEQKWPDTLPGKIKAAVTKAPDQTFTFLHCVKPNDERQRGKYDASGMPHASYYCTLDEPVILEEGGYNTFPYAISRYVTAPGETYGRSPAMQALPDIKILNEAMKVTHRQWHQALEPPWLTGDDSANVLQTRPGAINRGMVDENGRPRVLPLVSGSQFDVSFELTGQKRDTINDVFLVRILQTILDNPQMTATQVLEIAQQKGVLLAPVMGRQQSEFLGPLIEREFDLLYEAGMFPEPPAELLEMSDGEYEIDYESPLATAQKAQAGLSVLRLLESIGGLAQVKPEVLDLIDTDEAVRQIGASNGVPEKIWASKESVEATREQRAQQQEQQMAMEAAPGAASAIKDVAGAAKMVYDADGRLSEIRQAG